MLKITSCPAAVWAGEAPAVRRQRILPSARLTTCRTPAVVIMARPPAAAAARAPGRTRSGRPVRRAARRGDGGGRVGWAGAGAGEGGAVARVGSGERPGGPAGGGPPRAV